MSAMVVRGDAARVPLPDASVDLVVTSPPYFGLRSYTDGGEHYDGQIGSEAAPREYVGALLACTREWMRVLKPSGSLFVNLGDKYQATSFDPARRRKDASGVQRPSATMNCERCGAEFTGGLGRRFCSSFCGGSDNSKRAGRGVIPNKSLLGLPWRYALGCVDDLGLTLRAEIIWAKPNGLPESVTDRVRRSHEQVFHFTKQPRYFSAVDEIREASGQPSHRRTVAPNRGMVAGPGVNGQQITEGGLSAALTGQGFIPNQHNPLGKLPGSVWEIPSQPLTVPARLGIDHFAAFPMELPRRIILGWSPPGICVACGEGRRPVVNREVEFASGSGRSGRVPRGKHEGSVQATSGTYDIRMGPVTRNTITGYACACPDAAAPTRPAVVLDPFGGTGTTALVAAMHGRLGLSLDRSADYCRLARWRTTDPAERARALGVAKPPPVLEGQEALFGDVAP